ncbi:MAG: YceI family protein [Xanthomonadales bacterium]|nr:YceI family protein [Xanthomonadales bacterium]
MMKRSQLIPWSAGLLLCAILGLNDVRADWAIDNDHSRVAFVSTKAGNVAEVHRFGSLSGTLGEDGAFAVDITLDSVDTGIEIRDERMRELLFQTDRYPRARLSAQLDMAQLKTIGPGEQGSVTAEAELNLHGQRANLTIDAAVARLEDGTLLVTSEEPLVITASQFELLAGVERLREIAGLPSISPAVPVTFRLTLRPKAAPTSAVS